MTKKIDRTGHRYGNLTVLSEAEPKRHPGGDVSVHWICKCDCGTVKPVSGKALGSGLTISCGCASAAKAKRRLTKHGMCGSAEYRTWRHMIDRCTNPSDAGYAYYGGRGIRVHKPWVASFRKFYDYVGPRPGSIYSIDRVDNNGNYEPGNVRWATPTQQANNKRRPKRKTHCVAGHALTAENVYVQEKTGYRFCLKCRSRREAERCCRRKHARQVSKGSRHEKL